MTTEQWEARMSNLTKENQVRISKEQQDYLDDTQYPGDIPDMMPVYRQFTFMHENEVSLNISAKYWLYMFGGPNTTFTLSDISCFLSVAKRRTFREWLNYKPYPAEDNKSALVDWVTFCNQRDTMEAVLNPLVETKFNALYQTIMTGRHLVGTGQSKSLPPSHKNPVVAVHEAIHGKIKV